jgi:hypothetical protein
VEHLLPPLGMHGMASRFDLSRIHIVDVRFRNISTKDISDEKVTAFS